MRAPVDRWDVVSAAGAALLAYGAWMIARPAGVLVAAVALLIVGLTGARSAKGGAG